MPAGAPSGVTDERGIIRPGTQLNGIYEIDAPLAAGGMGEVYRGHAIQTGDPVAIKLIRSDMADNEQALALFRKEASALHHLHHEVIVRYFVFSIDPVVQRPYLAMELVEGVSLSVMLEHGPLPAEAVHALQKRIASGLHAAHERGIVHRDVSPDNIIVPDEDLGRARIIDFGIARSTRLGDGTIIGGGFAGKYNYVSPEQLGLYGGEVTGQSDIYSFGLVLAHALRGKAIDMGGSQVDIIEKRRQVPDLSEIDPRIRPLVERMLAPDPADRFRTMADVAGWSLGTRPPAARPVPADDRTVFQPQPKAAAAASASPAMPAVAPASAPPARSGGGRLVLFGLGGTALAAIAGAAFWFSRGEVPVRVEPPAVTLASVPNPQLASPQLANPQLASPPPARPAEQQSVASAPPPASVPAPEPGPVPPQAAPAAPEPPAIAGRSEPAGIAPPVTASDPRVLRMTNYITGYDGGSCFYITPTQVTPTNAAVEAFGTETRPFELFDAAFKRDMGIEADIGLHQVMPSQCPVVQALGRLRGSAQVAAQLEITNGDLRSGGLLEGTLAARQPIVDLLIVDQEGKVWKVTKELAGAADRRRFAMRVALSGSGAAQPMLLVAVASTQPIAALNGDGPFRAEALFPVLLAEARRTPEAPVMTARYFRLN